MNILFLIAYAPAEAWAIFARPSGPPSPIALWLFLGGIFFALLSKFAILKAYLLAENKFRTKPIALFMAANLITYPVFLILLFLFSSSDNVVSIEALAIATSASLPLAYIEKGFYDFFLKPQSHVLGDWKRLLIANLVCWSITTLVLLALSLNAQRDNHILLVKWHAHNGEPSAQLRLADYYFDPLRGNLDTNAGYHWLRKAAEHGHIKAQARLGIAYTLPSAEALSQNFEEAIRWLRPSAEKGDPDAQAVLAGLYRNGNGVEQDYKKAAELYLAAAHHRAPFPSDYYVGEAQYELSQLYRFGKGVPQNDEEEYFWLLLSVKGISPKPHQERISELEKELSSERKDAISGRLLNWHKESRE